MAKKKAAAAEPEPYQGPLTTGTYLPPVKVRVKPSNTVGHNETIYTEGDVVELPARTAEHLIVAGHVEAYTDE